MYIRQAILHILDKDSGNLLLSELSLDLSDVFTREYINKIIKKVQQSEQKRGKLEQEAKLLTNLASIHTSFVEKSTQLATRIYDVISPAEEIPAADYLFFEATDDEERNWFGFIRLDYKQFYTHFLDAQNGIANQLIRHNTILPAVTQVPSEAFLLDLVSGEYSLIEKRYAIEGSKTLYLSKQVLELNPIDATPQQIKQLKRVVTQVAKQYDEQPYEVLAATQQIIYEQLDEANEIIPDKVIERAFEKNLSAQTVAKEALANHELPAKLSVNNVPKYEKKYCKQKFKLANGIEITIPVELYGNSDVVEFINHPDGTISVIIKNIEAIANKFNG